MKCGCNYRFLLEKDREHCMQNSKCFSSFSQNKKRKKKKKLKVGYILLQNIREQNMLDMYSLWGKMI